MARSTIRKHLDVSVPENQAFLDDPDAREHHQTQWHQWGILTHTRVFLHDFDHEVTEYLRAWGLQSQVNGELDQRIDGVTKRQLLKIVILLHDIGKFGARKKGRERFHFAGHEELSRRVILHDLDLPRFGLTARQIEYIALAAGDHFVLGLVRKRAREHGEYNRAFVDSPAFAELCRDIQRKYPEDYIEIGLLYLGDSLAKLAPPAGPALAQTQYDLNIAVAHRYLTIVLAVPSKQNRGG